MKRIISIFVLLALLLCACGDKVTDTTADTTLVVTDEIIAAMKQVVDETIKERDPAYEITECKDGAFHYDAGKDRYDYRMSIYYDFPGSTPGITYGFCVTYDMQTGEITLDEYK